MLHNLKTHSFMNSPYGRCITMSSFFCCRELFLLLSQKYEKLINCTCQCAVVILEMKNSLQLQSKDYLVKSERETISGKLLGLQQWCLFHREASHGKGKGTSRRGMRLRSCFCSTANSEFASLFIINIDKI